VVYNGLYNKLSSQEKLLTQKIVLAIPSHSCYARRRRAAFSKSKKRTGKKPKIKLQCKSDAKNRFKGRKTNKYCRGTSLLFSLFFTTFKAFFHSTTFCFSAFWAGPPDKLVFFQYYTNLKPVLW
jgi:hypothetical protein